MAIDPSKKDYDNDGVSGSANDLQMAEQDTNKDGAVSPKEKAAAKKKADAPKDTTSVTEYANGQPTKTTSVTPGQAAPKVYKTAADYGVSEDFLVAYPDMVDFIRKAIAGDYSDAEFNQELQKTQYGIDRTAAQEAFDIAIKGPQSEDMLKLIADKTAIISKQAMAAGINLSPEELNKYATEAVRSATSDTDIVNFLASSYTVPVAGQASQSTTGGGQAASIYSQISQAANSYGLTMTDDTIQTKVREGLSQGAGWQTWLEGQKVLFKQQAKMLYPTVANQLDNFTVTELVDPYMNSASQLLGINKTNMNAMDPMWSGALNGPNGPLSSDEWVRILKTDPKFGYDRTLNARTNAATLGDELLATFGMA